MKHIEKAAPIAAAWTSLTMLVCCVPVGFAASAATAGLGMVVATYQPPGSVWSDRMPPVAVFNGRPVVDVVDAMEQALGASRAYERTKPTSTVSGQPRSSELVFLTRLGCANTTVMRANLDAALKSLGVTSGYEVVDQDTLPDADTRRGYPSPTLLYADRDVFGLPQPKAPLPEPT